MKPTVQHDPFKALVQAIVFADVTTAKAMLVASANLARERAVYSTTRQLAGAHFFDEIKHSGADPNAIDKSGVAPLHRAVRTRCATAVTHAASCSPRASTGSAWSKRFFARAGRMPGMVQAGTYSSVMHYLRSMQAVGTTEGAAVAAQMHALPVDEFCQGPGARGRPPAPRFLPGGGEGAERVHCAVGLLQDPPHHPGAGGGPAARAIEVRAHKALTSHATARSLLAPNVSEPARANAA